MAYSENILNVEEEGKIFLNVVQIYIVRIFLLYN